eukprot:1322550-Amorphochlora_amoeboformis.AAC.2
MNEGCTPSASSPAIPAWCMVNVSFIRHTSAKFHRFHLLRSLRDCHLHAVIVYMRLSRSNSHPRTP